MRKSFVIAAASVSTLSVFTAHPPAAAAPAQVQKALPGGLGVTALQARNYPEALRLFTAGADQGDALSTFYLAGMYARGEGVKVDGVRATALYRQAAETGDATPLAGSTVSGQAMYALAKIYRYGGLAGIRTDEAEAARWYGRWSGTVDPRIVSKYAPPPTQSSACPGGYVVFSYAPGDTDSTLRNLESQAAADRRAMCAWQTYTEKPSPRSLPTSDKRSGVRLP